MKGLGLILLLATTGCAQAADPGTDWVCGIAQDSTGNLERDIAGFWLERSGPATTAWEIRADGTAVSDYLNEATGTRAEQGWNWFLEDDTTIRFSGVDAESRFTMELADEGWRRAGVDSFQRCLPS